MYKRKPNEYNRIDRLAIELYVDYGLNKFPIDEKSLCRKLGISLVPYSAYEGECRRILYKESTEGSFSYGATQLKPIVFYNDGNDPFYGNTRQTILHEIKHFIDEDENDSEDDLAEHFARYMACPTPYLVWKNIIDVNEIISTFGVSATIAGYVSSSVKNRINKYGYKIFNYEKPLIDLFKNKEGSDNIE